MLRYGSKLMRLTATLASLLALNAVPALSQTSTPAAPLPNIVFILTDDLTWNLVDYMPNVRQMQREGVTFRNFFVTDSLCCPSRASIFTGRMPHNTKVFTNGGREGGFAAFQRGGWPTNSLAPALHAAGIRTAMMGKYLNLYDPRKNSPQPDWDTWAVTDRGYNGFRYYMNIDGHTRWYGAEPKHYVTDVIAHQAAAFIRESAGRPFFIEVATFAPHSPEIPAPRHEQALAGLQLTHGPSFNTPMQEGQLRWLSNRPALSRADEALMDRIFRHRAQTVLAVDEMIGLLRRQAEAAGVAASTYFVFSSDNGYHIGEHRLFVGKMTPFDHDIHVPLIVVGPRVPAGREVTEMTANIDLAPTFTELLGARMEGVDGRSLVPLLRGNPVANWRRMVLVEHHGPVTDPNDPDFPFKRNVNPPSYNALRSEDWMYAEYADGERQYHDRRADPYEQRNIYASLPIARQAELHELVAAAATCRGEASCWSALGGGPDHP